MATATIAWLDTSCIFHFKCAHKSVLCTSFTLTTQIAWKVLQKGADPSAKAEEGSNALHYLCRRGNLDSLQINTMKKCSTLLIQLS